METREHKVHHFLTKFLLLLAIQAILADCCIEHERQALLIFKADVTDPGNRLDSWRGNKCCNWEGIKCSNQTGHVVRLILQNPYSNNYMEANMYWDHVLSGTVSRSLIALSNLQYLDLSYNNFSEFPAFIGSFEKLKYLNLSNAGFSGKIPPQLGNLSQLQFLDLSYNYELSTSAHIWWLSHLTSLRHIDMSWVHLKDATEWVQSLNKLPLLEVLILERNGLTHIPQSLLSLNITSLRVLQLSYQNFNTTIPSWIFSLHGLTDLNLAGSQFVGPFPDGLQNLTSISKLVLDYNQLYGKIPPLYNLTKLTYLSLSSIPMGEHITITEISSSFAPETWKRLEGLVLTNTGLTGSLTGWIGEMSNLKYLYLGDNNLSGPIPDDIGNLKNLIKLDLSYNSLAGSITHWQPSFQLDTLFLDSCQLGPLFPAWLQNQVEIERLYLSGTGIDDVLPDWFWSLASLYYVDLSNNTIRGKLPKSLKILTRLKYMYLDDNSLEGKLPSFFPDSLHEIYLSNNRFEELPPTIEARNLGFISLANNSISGSIGSSFCRITELYYLDLSNNNLSGSIPSTLCSSGLLLILQLNNNNLTGEFPNFLRFCKELVMLDIGNNKFHGELPEWIGEKFASLEFLRLRFNSFSGSIPSKLTLLNHLRILDLGNNHLSGHIPTHLGNLTAMVGLYGSPTYGEESMYATIKGVDRMYLIDSMEYLRSMDLSNNNLTGVIPDTIVALAGLLNLNLSHNHLIGNIPAKIGEMKSLESLDLSTNNLSGSIPQSMSALNFLEVLNLSYNNLSGSIPTGYQLQSLDNPSIYMGNPYLCGPPLETSCGSNGSYSRSSNNRNHTDDREKLWLYLFVEFGFVVGFLGLFFVLLCKRGWRYAYFQTIDNVFDKIYVLGALTLRRLKDQA